MDTRYRVIGVGFDHMHIGDQLATALAHPSADVVGVHDSTSGRAESVLADLGIDLPVHAELPALLDAVDADIAFVCSTTAQHLTLVETLAARGVHVILEKPMADSEAAAARMAAVAEEHGVVLGVNWPLAWVPSHRTARRLIIDGAIGTVEQVHYYDGNRGPLLHSHGKAELHPSIAAKAESWWYRPEAGGGSLRDYLGYGTTLATWFRDGELPHTVTAVWHVPEGLQVDEQSVVIGHYADGLSVFETRWGTHTDPWTLQPEPRCGFVISGSRGSIASWDYADGVDLHRAGGVERVPVDRIAVADQTALANVIAHLETGRPLDGPLTAATSLDGHRMLEAAFRSASTGSSVRLDRGAS